MTSIKTGESLSIEGSYTDVSWLNETGAEVEVWVKGPKKTFHTKDGAITSDNSFITEFTGAETFEWLPGLHSLEVKVTSPAGAVSIAPAAHFTVKGSFEKCSS